LKKERSKKYKFILYIRILSQIVFFGLFFHLILSTRFPGEDYIGNVEIFFHFDPLLALATILASRMIFLSFVYAAITIVVTFFMGRVVCGWICPLGSIHQFFSFLFKKSKLLKPKKIKENHTTWKYILLIFILVGSLFTLNLVGIVDPFSFLYRSFTTGFLPALSYSISSFIGVLYKINLSSLGDSLVQFFESIDLNATFLQGFFIGIIFIIIVLLNIFQERFWCRYVCPLGAFLGLISRGNIFKPKIDNEKCIKCDLCNINCPTQANPFPASEWKSSECIYCYTCSSICPTGAIGFPLKLTPEGIETIDLSRRKVILTSILGVLAVPFFRISQATKRASEKLIRPPGALQKRNFCKNALNAASV